MSRDYEQEARANNWVPEEEWKGDPPKQGFKTAQQWVEDGEKILPIVQSRLDKVESKLEKSEQSNAQLAQHFQSFKEREEKEKASLREELEKAKQQAITDGDGEAFMRAEKQLLEAQPTQELNPIQNGWLGENNWYGKDENLTIFADGISSKLIIEGFTDQSPAYFDELTKRVKAFAPDTFGNPNKGKPSAVESIPEKGNTSKEKSYENLPPDAKRACDDFASQGFMSKEDYVKTYDWETADV